MRGFLVGAVSGFVAGGHSRCGRFISEKRDAVEHCRECFLCRCWKFHFAHHHIVIWCSLISWCMFAMHSCVCMPSYVMYVNEMKSLTLVYLDPRFVDFCLFISRRKNLQSCLCLDKTGRILDSIQQAPMNEWLLTNSILRWTWAGSASPRPKDGVLHSLTFFFTQTALTVYHCTRLMGLVETDVSTGGNSPSTSSIPGHEWYNDAVSRSIPLASSGAGDWLVTSCIAGRSHHQTFDTPRHSQLAASWAWHDSNYLLKYTASSQHPSNR